MKNLKTRYISDNIHGSIAFSSLIEKRILANPLFNRLQGIKQNSTAFKTYPSLEHSRFIHSLGVMHLASQMFYHSMLNAEDEILTEFIQSFKDYLVSNFRSIKDILKDHSFIDHLCAKIGKKVTDESRSHFQSMIDSIDEQNIEIFSKFFENDKIFSYYNMSNLNKEDSTIYLMILQSVRTCALFHDLGHPPYSHAVEFAIQDFYKRYSATKHDNQTKDQKKYIEIMSHYLDYINTTIGYPDNKPFHESVTIVFIINIFKNLVASSWEDNIQDDNDKITFDLYLIIIKTLTLSIYLGYPLTLDVKGTPKLFEDTKLKNSNSFSALKNLISGEIDADRLDYVMRDAKNSGFSSHSFNLSRIISNFSLYKKDQSFHFLSSIRSLNDIEKFLKERLAIYRYIIFHHNVVKTDLILYKILDYVLRLTVLEDNQDHLKHWKYLWEYLDTKNIQNFDLVGIEKFIITASAWNEHWLMSSMNISYQIIYNKYVKGESVTENESKLYRLLKEFLYNRRNLISLWKRHYSFMQFADLFSKRILSTRKEIISTFVEYDEQNVDNIEKPSIHKINIKTKKSQIENLLALLEKNLEQKNAFELAREKVKLVQSFIEILYQFDKDVEDRLEIGISKQLKNVYGKEFAVYIRILSSRLKPGIVKEHNIAVLKDHSNDEISIEKLGEVSSIVEELEQTVLYSPQFHLYIAEVNDLKLCRTSIVQESDIEQFYQIVIDCIIKEFKNCLSLNNIKEK